MPKIKQPPKRLDSTTDLMHCAHAHWLAVGWMVAREAGIEPPAPPLGGQPLAKWQNAKNLPAMLKVYKPQAELMYRIRRLCLLLHDHPNATICGGPEQWWQLILQEDILGAICDRLAPEVMPEAAAIKSPTRAVSSWWLRRGINAVNPVRRPATWALIEAVQGRCYPRRVELAHPSDDIALPVSALNGQMSLTRRKTLLRDLTGSDAGWSVNHSIELTRDWMDVLAAWQSTDKETPKSKQSTKVAVDQVQQYEMLAPIIHNALMPTWWANQSRILKELNNTLENKPSHCKGFGAVKEKQQKSLDNNQSAVRINSATEKELRQSANPSQPLKLLTHLNEATASERKTQLSREIEP